MIHTAQQTSEQGLYFEGYASVFNVQDKEGDIVLPNAFSPTTSKIPLLQEHDSTKVLGYITHTTQDNMGLFVKGIISSLTPDGQSIISLIQNKMIKGLSIGYLTKEWEDYENGRMIKSADLVEVSIVAIPTNDLAQITSYQNLTPQNNPDKNGSKPIEGYKSTILDKRLSDILSLRQRLVSSGMM